MGRLGRPLKDKLLAGEWKNDRLRPRIKPIGQPSKPRGLSKEAGKFWDRVVPQLEAMGVVGELDQYSLEAMSRWYAGYITAMDNGDTKTANTCFQNFNKLAGAYGLNPKDRKHLDASDPKDDELDQFIKRA